MEKTNVSKSVDQETIEKIGEIIATAEKFKNSFFWSPPHSAKERRSMGNKNSHPRVEWNENGNVYTASYSVSCSCNNVYASGHYTKNGKDTNLTAIRNSYKRLCIANQGCPGTSEPKHTTP